ncbi:DUF3347 domain-containing protein [Chitinophaga rhizophila]|uniref:DUF3347 domain-containing protein n=1 Tax=Chitinophaga rhizophila TaxID=2866212 RepID=A0ABS7G5S2_9BACT|nr:DUF3347 domain-containing protein [Chitinophaga rhizophila]MBW8682990.1 DUF3347 domain-containing protein [Chitinophaga rhizophila]
MKQLMKVAVLPVSAIFLLTACRNAPTNNTSVKEGEQEAVSTATISATAVQLKDDKLNAVYQQYAQLTTALTNGDAKAAQLAGNAIEAGAGALKDGGALAQSAAKITATADIEAQREAYSTLSNELIGLVKQAGVAGGVLYVDYCPMAMEDKGGYWLSGVEEIRNPYFGESMMTCGEVKEKVGH